LFIPTALFGNDCASVICLRGGRLFEERAVEPVLAAFKAYKNADNGFGNALEHDIRSPAAVMRLQPGCCALENARPLWLLPPAGTALPSGGPGQQSARS